MGRRLPIEVSPGLVGLGSTSGFNFAVCPCWSTSTPEKSGYKKARQLIRLECSFFIGCTLAHGQRWQAASPNKGKLTMPSPTSRIYSADAFRKPSSTWALPGDGRSSFSGRYTTGDEVSFLMLLTPEGLERYLETMDRRKDWGILDPDAIKAAAATLLKEYSQL